MALLPIPKYLSLAHKSITKALSILQESKYITNRFPYLVMVVASIVVILYQNDLHGFRGGHHGFLSSHGMTLTRNLSPRHGFLMFDNMSANSDGTTTYYPYESFPISTFALLKLFTVPFFDDLSMQIAICRNVMNLFFVGAFFTAFLAFRRLATSALSAVTIVLFAFSSYYLQYYNDMVFNDTPTLFGILLTFHGMVVYSQENRFGQLIGKATIALLLGWQPYALLLAFVLCGCVSTIWRSRRFLSIIQNRYFVLGIVSILVGCFLLGSNITIERAMTGKKLSDVSLLHSIAFRTGAADDSEYQRYARNLAWSNFVNEQFYRVGRMSVPDIAFPELATEKNGKTFEHLKVYGIVVTIICFTGILFFRRNALFTSLFLSGYIWAFPMRHFTAFHDFQSIYYIGVPLALYSLTVAFFDRISTLFSGLLVPIALTIFCLSNVHLNKIKASGSEAPNEITTDFQKISEIVGIGNKVFIDGNSKKLGGAYHAIDYYLAGNYFQSSPDDAKFVVARNRRYNKNNLTPKNQKIFVFMR